MIESEIRWGTDYAASLSFAHPQLLDNVRTWRRPVPGSRRMRIGAGTTDAWVSRRDYVLAGTARHFKGSAWGQVGLQDFLDWAGAGNTFRFIPDTRYPNVYVDNCYLDSPFDDPAPAIEDADGWQSIDIVIRQQSFDFTVAMRGLIFEYVPGKVIADMGGTFARADAATCATYVDRNGVVRTVAANILRDAHFISGVRTVLLEPSRANICLQSQTFNTSWGTTRATVSANARTAPDGTTTADDLVEDGTAANSHIIGQSGITITADASVAFSVYAKALGRSWVRLKFYDTATGSNGFGAYFNVATGAAGTTLNQGTGALSLKKVESLGGSSAGWYRCTVAGTVGGGVTACSCDIFIAEADNDSTFDGNSTASLSLWGAQVENSAAFPTSYIATTTASVTRTDDSLYLNYTAVPQELTFYCRFVERGTSLSSNGRIMVIGDDTLGTDKYLTIYKGTNGYRAQHSNGSAAVTTADTLTAPSFGDTVELRLVLASTGAITLYQSVNGAAETATATTATNTLAAAWTLTRIYLTQTTAGTAHGTEAFDRVRIMAGTQTLATMQGA